MPKMSIGQALPVRDAGPRNPLDLFGRYARVAPGPHDVALVQCIC